MQFWTRPFVVLLPCWLLVAVGNQLLLVYQLLELLLWGTVLFRHKYLHAWKIHQLSLGPYLKIIWCRYSNIFVTAPSPENLKTLFEFICKGLDVLDYKVKLLSLTDSYHCLSLIKMHLVAKDLRMATEQCNIGNGWELK